MIIAGLMLYTVPTGAEQPKDLQYMLLADCQLLVRKLPEAGTAWLSLTASRMDEQHAM